MTRGRYRWRTAVRIRTPWWLVDRGAFGKGRGDDLSADVDGPRRAR